MNYSEENRYQEHIDAMFNEKSDEILTEFNCPVCGYPIVLEYGLEVCYSCGWSGAMR